MKQVPSGEEKQTNQKKKINGKTMRGFLICI